MEAKALNATAGARVAWIDNIRWTVIAMVVLMHACVTYSGMGSWFYNEATTQDIASTLVFSIYQTFSQAFFMGLMFFLAGIMIPAAYDRKGFLRFVGDRAVRLGVPSLVFMLLLDPLLTVIRRCGRPLPRRASPPKSFMSRSRAWSRSSRSSRSRSARCSPLAPAS
jgi:peptidoglycan/LPS O-acetylase OafA/YrhL